MSSQDQDLGQEIVVQLQDVLSRIQSKDLFQSDWDIACFIIFLLFIGTAVLLVLLVLIRCCCCCCCCDCESSHQKPQNRKVGVDNLALEP
ncbi:small integral membrane protein 22 [Latimeria chalumnae]|uniref:small integral membrane protein 22 n=1 Tax=Latimeria chalumnae TaxID=7897 RepID=UPI0006D92D99|nr:PREDICTED: small integral membrane protein 22 [Latimeria chalumnae]|eukprot:XP_014348198.1 PREDICTED: small integral membrane protein 22 [Latimeria chalumnae]